MNADAIAIIPARGGSRRIPRKNIRDFLGKPILGYPMVAARMSGLFVDVWVSTEDVEIARQAMLLGAKLHPRQKEFAEDAVGTQEVIRNAILELYPAAATRPAYTCGIYPCAPMLHPGDLQTAYEYLRRGQQYAYAEGIFYFGRTEAFLNDVSLEVGQEFELGPRGIDINVESDWLEAERLYKAMLARHQQRGYEHT